MTEKNDGANDGIDEQETITLTIPVADLSEMCSPLTNEQIQHIQNINSDVPDFARILSETSIKTPSISEEATESVTSIREKHDEEPPSPIEEYQRKTGKDED